MKTKVILSPIYCVLFFYPTVNNVSWFTTDLIYLSKINVLQPRASYIGLPPLLRFLVQWTWFEIHYCHCSCMLYNTWEVVVKCVEYVVLWSFTEGMDHKRRRKRGRQEGILWNLQDIGGRAWGQALLWGWNIWVCGPFSYPLLQLVLCNWDLWRIQHGGRVSQDCCMV